MIIVLQGEITEITQPERIPINISSVTGAIQHTSNYSLITIGVNQKLTVTGTVNIPDRAFNVPIKWKGDYRIFRVEVVSGVFAFDIWFEDSGVGLVDDSCVNKDLPIPMFSLPNTIQFDVVAI